MTDLPTREEERRQLGFAMMAFGIRMNAQQKAEVLRENPNSVIVQVVEEIAPGIDQADHVGVCLLLRDAQLYRPQNRVSVCDGDCGRLIQWSPTMPCRRKMCAWCASKGAMPK